MLLRACDCGARPPFVNAPLLHLSQLVPPLALPAPQVDVTEAETPVQVGDSACLICEQRPLNSLSDVSRLGLAGWGWQGCARL